MFAFELPILRSSTDAVSKHTPQAIAAWARGLHKRFGDKPIALVLKLRRGPIVSALQEYPQLTLFYVGPQTLALYRGAFTPSHARLMSRGRQNRGLLIRRVIG